MRKIFISLLTIFMLVGCTNIVEEKKEPVEIYLFYLDTCQHCNAFKEVAVPAIEKELKDEVEFHYVNMDFEGNNEIYDSFTEKLEDYHGDARLVPFIVVDGYFAILMYNEGEEATLIKDIKAARNNEPVSDYFKEGRWFFKEEYHA